MSSKEPRKEQPPPIGCLFHWSSKKLVQPRGGGSLSPVAVKPEDEVKDGTELVLHDNEGNNSSIYRLKNRFRFVPVDGAGHCGYIEHVTSNKYVHPEDDRLTPGNGTRLILRSSRTNSAAALFGFRTIDGDDILILHRSGKMCYPKGGKPTPENGTPLVLNSDLNDVTKFYFGDLDAKPMKGPYPEPHLSGDWKFIKAWVSPTVNFTYTVTYKVGRSKTVSEKVEFAWDVSAQVAYGCFKGRADFSGFVESSTSETWNTETDVTTTYTVKAGQGSVYMWQYVFSMSQYGEELNFHSTIIGYSDSKSKRPVFK